MPMPYSVEELALLIHLAAFVAGALMERRAAAKRPPRDVPRSRSVLDPHAPPLGRVNPGYAGFRRAFEIADGRVPVSEPGPDNEYERLLFGWPPRHDRDRCC
jgi:hypothetical protein